MTKKRKNELTPEELAEQEGKPLPDREVMSILPIGDPTGPAFVEWDGPPDVETKPEPGGEEPLKGGV